MKDLCRLVSGACSSFSCPDGPHQPCDSVAKELGAEQSEDGRSVVGRDVVVQLVDCKDRDGESRIGSGGRHYVKSSQLQHC